VLLLFATQFATPFGEVEPVRIEQDFIGANYVQSHRRWFERWQYRLDDEVTPVPGLNAFMLAGTLRSTAAAPAIVLNLAPYLSWGADAELRLDVPDTIMATLVKGRYELEIVAIGGMGDSRDLIIGIVEIRQATHRT
jgi:hypothetical protein